MKFNLLASFVTLAVSSVSFSQSTVLVQGAVAFDRANLESVTVKPLCPAGVTCFANGTIATLTLEIPCAGGLVKPVAYQAVNVLNPQDGASKVYVSGISYTTKASILTRCFARSFETVTITLPNVYVTSEDFVDLSK